MAIDTSSIMSLVPIIGGLLSWVVFSLLMYACIRNVDQGKKRAAEDEWWDDEKSAADTRVGEPS